MAVTGERQPQTADFSGRHLVIGGNVVISIIVVAAIVGLAQWISFHRSTKFDLTSSGLNSLTPGTERLVGGLEQKVTLTNLYFETDLEEEDQSKYRRRIDDLVSLYQGINPSMVETRSINPLQDHAKREALVDELGDLKAFADEKESYQALAERFEKELLVAINALLGDQVSQLAMLIEQTADETSKVDLGQIQTVLEDRQRAVAFMAEDVQAAVDAAQPQYGAMKSALTQLYSGVTRDLNSILTFVQQMRAQRTSMPEAVKGFVGGLETAYRPLIARLEGETTTARGLARLEFESLMQQLGPTSNAILVHTGDEAKVVSFNDVWPAADPSAPSPGFSQRLFRGEEKVTSAILQLTVREKTAVVFTRFGGPPLFVGGGMPGMAAMGGGPGPYSQMKGLLEDANFVVKEWDVATMDAPPEIDPVPVRTIYVVMRPVNPPPSFGQPQQGAEFSDLHKQRVLGELGDNPRAVFVAGWMPGAFGAFPEAYQYDDYLSATWGVHVATDFLMLQAFPYPGKPGEMMLSQQSFMIGDLAHSDHPVVKGMVGDQASMRLAAPIEIVGAVPEGVSVEKLVWRDAADGLWGIKDFTKYEKKVRAGKSVTLEEGDIEGPFTLAVAAEKGDGKVVVVSGRSPFSDDWALAPALVVTSQGFTMRQRNPGNVHLLLNSLHWLNDREEWLDVGKPVDIGTIAIDQSSGSMRAVRAFAYAGWPATALLVGGIVWWMRRR